MYFICLIVSTLLFQLKANKFLNIDAIIEGALHKLVIKPLKKFIYQCFVNEYTK